MYKIIRSFSGFNSHNKWGLTVVISCLYIKNSHTHTVVIDQTLRGLLLFFPLSLYLRHSHRLCTRTTSEDRWEQRTDSWGPIVPIEKISSEGMAIQNSHTHTHKKNVSRNNPVTSNNRHKYQLVILAWRQSTQTKLDSKLLGQLQQKNLLKPLEAYFTGQQENSEQRMHVYHGFLLLRHSFASNNAQQVSMPFSMLNS